MQENRQIIFQLFFLFVITIETFKHSNIQLGQMGFAFLNSLLNFLIIELL